MNSDQIIDGYLNNHTVVKMLDAEQRMLLRRIFKSIPSTDSEAFVKMSGNLMSFCSKKLTGKQRFEHELAQITSKALELILEHNSE